MIKSLVIGAVKIAELNSGLGTNQDEYPFLKTDYITPEDWWNSLDYDNKIDIGGVAIHYNKISSDYKWDCGYKDEKRKHTPYSELKKSQRKIIADIFKQRNKPFQKFPIHSMLLL